jgi:Tol biopolymer transport system component
MKEKELKKMKIASAILAVLLFFSLFFALATDQATATTPEIDIIVDEGNITDHLWSSDGTKIAYIKCPEGQFWGDLWIAEWDGKEIKNKQLIYTEADYNHLEDWQGDWILFMIRGEDSTPDEYYGRNELWKIRDDGSDLTQITFTYTNGIKYTENGYYYYRGSVGWGRFIPGTELVYFSAHNGNGWYRPYTCNNDGTDQWNYVSASDHPYSFTIGMSPTGNKLVWGNAWYWNAPTEALMVCNPDGTEREMIKSFDKRTFPLVLADGNTVVYSWYDGDIHAIDMDGSNDRMILNDEYFNHWENYHPVDGQSLLMTSDRVDGNKHIFKINIDGTEIIQLTDGLCNDDRASYSQNAHEILYRRMPLESEPYQLVIKRIVKLIEIDIKPCSLPNPINLKSKGKITVAILTTDDFDASTVDPVTIEFAGASPLKWHLSDVDLDGDIDLVLHFKTQELELTNDSIEATLTGETFDSKQIIGTDSVRIVPLKICK